MTQLTKTGTHGIEHEDDPYGWQYDHFAIVYVQSSGDYWLNKDEVIKNLYKIHAKSSADQKILLHFTYQAFSIKLSGMYDILLDFLKNTKRNPNTIFIHSPSINEDYLGFKNIFKDEHLHCDEFYNCQGYWVDEVRYPDNSSKRFAHLIGRETTPRLKLFFDIYRYDLSDYFFLSKLDSDDIKPDWQLDEKVYDSLNLWFTSDEQPQFINWYENRFDVKSVDNLNVNDQYDPTKTARRNIVQRSNEYFIDVVFETITIGDVFAPTEKLIRSLITEKPFIVYASANFLKQMQDIGFKTFSDVWDESYDGFELTKRYDLMLTLIKQVCAMPPDKFQNLIKKTQDICKYNKQMLKELIISNTNCKTFDEWINKVRNIT